jgi:hypothetical protein
MIDDKGGLDSWRSGLRMYDRAAIRRGESLWACTIGWNQHWGDAPDEVVWDVYFDPSSTDLLRREYASFYGLSQLDLAEEEERRRSSSRSASSLEPLPFPGMTGNVIAPLKPPRRRRGTAAQGDLDAWRAALRPGVRAVIQPYRELRACTVEAAASAWWVEDEPMWAITYDHEPWDTLPPVQRIARAYELEPLPYPGMTGGLPARRTRRASRRGPRRRRAGTTA